MILHLPAGRIPLLNRARAHSRAAGGVLGLLVVWELLALTVFAGRFVLPAPTAVVASAVRDHFYFSDVIVTLGISWKGWLIGNGAAIVLAALCLVFPFSESWLTTLGVATYCVPTIAVGPLLVVAYGSTGAKIAMSALSVFFVTLVAAITGLRAASPQMLEMVAAFGGGRWRQLTQVRARASVPTLASGLSISAPAAILGTMIGDYLGGAKGLGVVMLQAQQQLDVSRTWAIAAVSTAVCGLAFAATSVAARKVSAGVGPALDAGITRRRAPLRGLKGFLAAGGRVLGVVLFGLAVWELIIHSSGLGSYFVKSPGEVWHYLFTGPAAGTHRHVLVHELARTAQDGGLGWLAGMVAAALAAMVLVLAPGVAATVMPLVLVLRSVPLIAMCPLIGLVFGRGLLGVTLIAAIVTFVPSLVTVLDGLRAVPVAATDLIECLGGRRWHSLTVVRLPFALPSLFAAAKISMPGAVLGAVLAEWLITGHGIGYAMSYDVISSDYGNLWAAIAVVLAVSLALYFVVGAIEGAVRQRVHVG